MEKYYYRVVECTDLNMHPPQIVAAMNEANTIPRGGLWWSSTGVHKNTKMQKTLSNNDCTHPITRSSLFCKLSFNFKTVQTAIYWTHRASGKEIPVQCFANLHNKLLKIWEICSPLATRCLKIEKYQDRFFRLFSTSFERWKRWISGRELPARMERLDHAQ